MPRGWGIEKYPNRGLYSTQTTLPDLLFTLLKGSLEDLVAKVFLLLSTHCDHLLPFAFQKYLNSSIRNQRVFWQFADFAERDLGSQLLRHKDSLVLGALVVYRSSLMSLEG